MIEMKDEKSSVKHYGSIGIVLIIFGISVFIANYERQTLQVHEIAPGQEIINYYAPLWDPLPHHVKISVASSEPLTLKSEIIDGDSWAETFNLEAGEKTLHVYPGETIKIDVSAPATATGTFKTLLWCDSWNYAAAILVILGLVLLRA